VHCKSRVTCYSDPSIYLNLLGIVSSPYERGTVKILVSLELDGIGDWIAGTRSQVRRRDRSATGARTPEAATAGRATNNNTIIHLRRHGDAVAGIKTAAGIEFALINKVWCSTLIGEAANHDVLPENRRSTTGVCERLGVDEDSIASLYVTARAVRHRRGRIRPNSTLN